MRRSAITSMFRPRKKHRIAPLLLIAILLAAIAYRPGSAIPLLVAAAVLYGLVHILLRARAENRGELPPDSPWPIWLFVGFGLMQLWSAWQLAAGETPTTHSRGLFRLIDLGVEYLGALPMAGLEASLGAGCLYIAWWIYRQI